MEENCTSQPFHTMPMPHPFHTRPITFSTTPTGSGNASLASRLPRGEGCGGAGSARSSGLQGRRLGTTARLQRREACERLGSWSAGGAARSELKP